MFTAASLKNKKNKKNRKKDEVRTPEEQEELKRQRVGFSDVHECVFVGNVSWLTAVSWHLG